LASVAQPLTINAAIAAPSSPDVRSSITIPLQLT
jgi:hypothetical protein